MIKDLENFLYEHKGSDLFSSEQRSSKDVMQVYKRRHDIKKQTEHFASFLIRLELRNIQ